MRLFFNASVYHAGLYSYWIEILLRINGLRANVNMNGQLLSVECPITETDLFKKNDVLMRFVMNWFHGIYRKKEMWGTPDENIL